MNLRHTSFRADGLSSAAAFSAAAAVMLLPANLLPVITTETSGISRTDTILSGVVELWHRGLRAIAVIVFVASIIIPFFKLAGLAWLIYTAQRGPGPETRRLTRFYTALDFVGRWSMLDVFLVAFLSGVVRFGAFSSVEPRSGIIAFALAVVLTVIATHTFDPKLLWRDHAGTPSTHPAHESPA